MIGLKTMLRAKRILKSLGTKGKNDSLSEKEKAFISDALFGGITDKLYLIFDRGLIMGRVLSIYKLECSGFVVFVTSPTYFGRRREVHVLKENGEKIFSVKRRMILPPKVYVFNEAAVESALNF